ncbi:MAG: UDP-N-acetylmuramoyl-tripeptide--D-alanyl-D-alanine ligase, partial [Actinomyces sp.]
MRFTAGEIAAVVGGHRHGPDVAVDGATQDSREVAPGMLFVPLVAERDGHAFVPAAVAAGAPAYLTARGRLHGSDTAATAVAVDDTGVALTHLGAAARDRLAAAVEVIGITGSVGKTTTKDLVAAVLAVERRVHASRRSFNNEIGVPLTLVNTPGDVEAVVVEMGARGRGHIADLCAVARPRIGVVTTVGAAHTGEFGSVDAVATAKAELVEALPSEGCAVLNADVAAVAAMADRTAAEVVTFGDRGEVRARELVLDDELRPRFRLESPWGGAEVRLTTRGAHLVPNALAAAAVGLHLGLGPETVAAGLADAVVSAGRMHLVRTSTGARVLDDTYNANPLSVAAALRALAHLPAARRVAVLGVMAELGDRGPADHAAMGVLARELGIELIAVDAPDYGGIDVADIDEAAERLG